MTEQQKLRCVVVDDEKLARELLVDLIRHHSELELCAAFRNTHALEGFLQANAVDLLFLDIHMPGQTGIDFLKSCEVQPRVILTTAFAEYALEGFELDVCDYLLKPITEERFALSLQRVLKAINIEQQADAFEQLQSNREFELLHIKSGAYEYRIPFHEITLLEANGEYIMYHTAVRKYMVLGALKKLAAELPDHYFLQVHRAYVVPINQIKAREKYQLMLHSGVTIPIGKTYRSTVVAALASLR